MYVAMPEDEFLLSPQSPPFGERLRDAQCHALAYRAAFAGLGQVAPHPLVGCVITDAETRLLAVAAHRRYGGAHAEVEAIAQAKARGGPECLRGARVFVTLQPCTHHGKTPPCAQLLLQHRPQQVFFGAYDPNPLVGNLSELQQAGIACHKYEHRELQWLDEAYFFHARGERQRPFVAVKIAASLDGAFAAPPGQPRLVLSSPRARQYGHFLRQRYDAIMIGAQTLSRDNPRLTVREPFVQRRDPQRVVIANAATLRADLQVLCHDPQRTLVVVPTAEAAALRARLPSPATLLPMPTENGRFELAALLTTLYQEHNIFSILVEGGGKLWASLFAAGLVDKVHLLQAPRLHPAARQWGTELHDSTALALQDARMVMLDSDWAIEGRIGAVA